MSNVLVFSSVLKSYDYQRALVDFCPRTTDNFQDFNKEAQRRPALVIVETTPLEQLEDLAYYAFTRSSHLIIETGKIHPPIFYKTKCDALGIRFAGVCESISVGTNSFPALVRNALERHVRPA